MAQSGRQFKRCPAGPRRFKPRRNALVGEPERSYYELRLQIQSVTLNATIIKLNATSCKWTISICGDREREHTVRGDFTSQRERDSFVPGAHHGATGTVFFERQGSLGKCGTRGAPGPAFPRSRRGDNHGIDFSHPRRTRSREEHYRKRLLRDSRRCTDFRLRVAIRKALTICYALEGSTSLLRVRYLRAAQFTGAPDHARYATR